MIDTPNPLDQLRTLLQEQKDTEEIEQIFKRIDDGAQVSVTEIRIPSSPLLAFVEGVRFVMEQLIGDFPDTSAITDKGFDNVTGEDWFDLTDMLMDHIQGVNYVTYETVKQILQAHLEMTHDTPEDTDPA